ncbi:Crp/Fnr family transcriptional regulator [Catelliglobosispora koreensis]|uniref:Crp/Fnr family transcriptional regulator n=1 Tax=Catelliglobosispora koreensis TaxID=129052 RepID=UPI0003808251|nr:cyclic nucleotide-binding domain-containing protein [Catelliglobosispora koreensis]
MNSVRDTLGEFSFLDEVPDTWLDRLSSIGHKVTYPTGQRIFHEGERAEHFWLITSGAVGLDLHVPGRGDILIETLREGDVLGWSWMFPPRRWHFGAVAARTVHAIQFNGEEVMRTCRENPALGMDLMQRFVALILDRLQATRMRLIDLYGYPPS